MRHDNPQAAAERLAAWLESSDDAPESVAAAFWDAVGSNLREGRIRLVFVADEIPATLKRLVEFLNEQMPRVEVLAVEIRQYRASGSNFGALVPRVVGQTSHAQAARNSQHRPPGVRCGGVPMRWWSGSLMQEKRRPRSLLRFTIGPEDTLMFRSLAAQG
jgi:hypothetical protein